MNSGAYTKGEVVVNGTPQLRYEIQPQLSFCPDTLPTRVKREDIERRINNRLYFQGITGLGYQCPILEAVNPRYRDEKGGKPDIVNFMQKIATEKDVAKIAEKARFIDTYSSLMDGINYGQFNRLRNQKMRHVRSKYGPTQRFCVPIVTSFDYGWWTRDQGQLDKRTWYQPKERFPTVRGDVTRFIDELMLKDPNFMFF